MFGFTRSVTRLGLKGRPPVPHARGFWVDSSSATPPSGPTTQAISVGPWGCSPGPRWSVGKRHAQTASGTKTEQKHRADIQGPLSRSWTWTLVLLLGGSPGSLQPTGLLAAHRPHLADAAGVIEAVADGVVVLLPARTLGGQQHVHGIQAV